MIEQMIYLVRKYSISKSGNDAKGYAGQKKKKQRHHFENFYFDQMSVD